MDYLLYFTLLLLLATAVLIYLTYKEKKIYKRLKEKENFEVTKEKIDLNIAIGDLMVDYEEETNKKITSIDFEPLDFEGDIKRCFIVNVRDGK